MTARVNRPRIGCPKLELCQNVRINSAPVWWSLGYSRIDSDLSSVGDITASVGAAPQREIRHESDFIITHLFIQVINCTLTLFGEAVKGLPELSLGTPHWDYSSRRWGVETTTTFGLVTSRKIHSHFSESLNGETKYIISRGGGGGERENHLPGLSHNQPTRLALLCSEKKKCKCRSDQSRGEMITCCSS